MTKPAHFMLGLCVAVSTSCVAAAQDARSIPKVLQITGEYTKPGKAHALHDKTEGAFVEAMSRANSPVHWIGMISLSGQKRALSFTWYDSFEAWEQSDAALGKKAALTAELSRDYIADGEMVYTEDQSVYVYQDEMSLRPAADLAPMRYMDIATYHVRPGHEREWIELVRMVRETYEKAVPEAQWSTYRQLYGGEGDTYLVLTARKSLAEIDRVLKDNNPRFAAALGEDGLKTFSDLTAASIASSEHQLFAFNPVTSYVPSEWIKSDNFWKRPGGSFSSGKPRAEEKKAEP